MPRWTCGLCPSAAPQPYLQRSPASLHIHHLGPSHPPSKQPGSPWRQGNSLPQGEKDGEGSRVIVTEGAPCQLAEDEWGWGGGDRQRPEGIAFRVETGDLGVSMTNHMTFGQASFLLCASVSSPVKEGQLLACLLHKIFGKKMPHAGEWS